MSVDLPGFSLDCPCHEIFLATHHGSAGNPWRIPVKGRNQMEQVSWDDIARAGVFLHKMNTSGWLIR